MQGRHSPQTDDNVGSPADEEGEDDADSHLNGPGTSPAQVSEAGAADASVCGKERRMCEVVGGLKWVTGDYGCECVCVCGGEREREREREREIVGYIVRQWT